MRRGWWIAAVAAAMPALGALPQDKGKDDLTDDEKIVHLLNRFTLGATPELVEEVRQTGIKPWLDRQLKGDLPEPDALTGRLKKYETIGMPINLVYVKYDVRPPEKPTPQEEEEARKKNETPSNETLAWVLLRAIYSANQTREVSADFFRNHFAVSVDKDLVRNFVTDWERDVIHANALGVFGTMLDAGARHPAMSFYLDNCLSRRPPTPQELKTIENNVRSQTRSQAEANKAVDIARQRGLNENYARELMELHTLGVDRFYSQADVISVAKCLTGWTFKYEAGVPPQFHFNPEMHCPGSKPFLGGSIAENKLKPIQEGESVLYILRKHEGTARFVTWKLLRALVHDDPDEQMLKRVYLSFWNTEGDLGKVFRTIVNDKKFFAREHFRAKLKRPFEFVISALRVTRAEVSEVGGILNSLQSMNESLYRCADPTGYYDQAEAWADPGAMAYRWAFAQGLVAGRINGVKIPPSFFEGLPAEPKACVDALIRKVLPVAGVGEATRAGLDRMIENELKRNPRGAPVQLGPRTVAMLLGSPEFQKQ